MDELAHTPAGVSAASAAPSGPRTANPSPKRGAKGSGKGAAPSGKGATAPAEASSPAPASPPSFAGAPGFATSDLTFGGEIGKGRFKRVLRATLKTKEGDKDVVVVRYSKSGDQKHELHVLAMLARQGPGAGRFIPQILGACTERREIIIIQERASFGSVKGAICGEGAEATEPWSVEHKVIGAMQVADAMAYLETIHVIHADLSCRNLLVFNFNPRDPSQTMVKVTDFGLAVVLKDGADHQIQKQPLAPRWCPPEQVLSNKMSHRTDVWSLGTTLWEFFSNGQSPWSQCEKRAAVTAKLTELNEAFQSGNHDLEDSIIREGFPMLDDLFTEAAYSVILSCLQVDENLRPTFVDIQKAFEELSKPKAEAKCDMDSLGSTGDASGVQGDEESPTPRAKPLARFGAWGEGEDQLFLSRCEALRDFLVSADAISLFGEEGAVEAFKAFLISREARSLKAMTGQRSRGSSANLTAGLAGSASYLAGNAAGNGHVASTTAIRDVLVPLAADGRQTDAATSMSPTPCMSSPRLYGPGGLATPGGVDHHSTLNIWVVQSLVGPALLRKQEFVDPTSAWVAYNESAAAGIPCMLRDPHGKEVAAQSWLVMDHTQAAKARCLNGSLRATTPAATRSTTPAPHSALGRPAVPAPALSATCPIMTMEPLVH